jgi:virginiamycin B lyase
MKTHGGITRFILLAFVAVALAACSTSNGSSGNVVPSSDAPDARSAKKLRAVIHIRIPKRRRHHHAARSHYISAATKSIGIVIQQVGSPSSTTLNAGLTPSSPGCSVVSGATVCTLKLALVPGDYTSTFTTYDGPLVSGSPTGQKLSANQAVEFTITGGSPNELNATLDGIPASAAISLVNGSALTGSSGTFALSKCETSPQPVNVVAVDADGYSIIGAGAPASYQLSSDDTVHLPVAAPAPGASPNAFALVPPATLTSANVPSANGVVHLTLNAIPLPGTGAVTPPASHATVTYNGDVCGIFNEYTTGLTSASGPFGITRGPDGAMWFSESVANNIGRIDTSGTIHEYPMTTRKGSNFGIAAGPDGNLWFTEGTANQIGVMSTSGAMVKEVSVPTSASLPFFITAGSDGNLWFTEDSGNKIGKIPTSATMSTDITEFAIPTSSAGLYDIASGPDGALWFAECGPTPNNVGRIPTSATTVTPNVSEYPVPTSNAGVQYLTSGPDGALWFGECTGNKIGRITTAGVVTNEYPLANPNSNPEGITTGPDGALWFAESGYKVIGRITTGGAITEYTANTFVGGFRLIATGPDGSIWFTEANNGIGRLR